MKILVIRFSSIGDIVLTTPVLRCIKQQIPNAEIHYLTHQRFKGLMEPNPYVSKVHVLETSLAAVATDLKMENFDLVVDLHNNLRTRRLQWLIGKKFSRFPKLNIQKFLLTQFRIYKLPKVHIVHRYLNAAPNLNLQYDGLGLDYFSPALPTKMEWQSRLPAEKFAVFAIGGTYATKRLPLPKLQELFTKTTIPLVLIGDNKDNAIAVEALQQGYPKIVNLCGQLSIPESALVLQKAALVFSHDTGMMHIAAALKKPIISIWGNTVPEFGMTPFYPDNVPSFYNHIFEVNDLRCRPCSKLGYDKCPKGHFQCMNNQNITEMVNVAEKLRQNES